MVRKLWIFFGAIVALVALWTLFTLTWSYSSGERAARTRHLRMLGD